MQVEFSESNLYFLVGALAYLTLPGVDAYCLSNKWSKESGTRRSSQVVSQQQSDLMLLYKKEDIPILRTVQVQGHNIFARVVNQ